MRTHARFSRGLALASCGALVSGLAFLPAGPASALGPLTQVYEATGTSSADASCTVTSGSSSVTNGPKDFHHGHAKGSVNLITTWTNGSNSSDVTTVTGRYGGSANLVKKHGAFRGGSVSGSGHVTITRALGSSSTCNVSAQLLNIVELLATQPTGWFYVTRNTTKGSLTETVVASPTLGKPALFEVYQGGKSSVTQRAFVKHGQYLIALAAGIEAGDYPIILSKNGSGVSRASNKNTLTAFFRNAGSELKAAKGSATQFVKFPGSVSCSHRSASLTWRGGASQVASSAFLVNGKKKASVTNPNAGHRVVLHHLSSTADNKISVKLSLKHGGKQTATDLYVPCHE